MALVLTEPARLSESSIAPPAKAKCGVLALVRAAHLALIELAGPALNLWARVMNPAVLSPCCDSEVLGAIVRRITVDVVDDLLWPKRAPKRLLQQVAMLANPPTIGQSEKHVAARPQATTTLPLWRCWSRLVLSTTRMRAVLAKPTRQLGGGAMEVLAALETSAVGGDRMRVHVEDSFRCATPRAVPAAPGLFDCPPTLYSCVYSRASPFEYHPENQEPYRVLLRRLGADAARAAGYRGPGI